jgi:hypothetical protein
MSEKRSFSIIDAFDRVKKRQCSEVKPCDTTNVIVDSTTTTTNDCERVSLGEIPISSEPSTSVTEDISTQSDIVLQPSSPDICVAIATDSNSVYDQMVKSIFFVCYDLL